MMDVEVEKYKGAVKKLKFAIIGSLMFFVVFWCVYICWQNKSCLYDVTWWNWGNIPWCTYGVLSIWIAKYLKSMNIYSLWFLLSFYQSISLHHILGVDSKSIWYNQSSFGNSIYKKKNLKILSLIKGMTKYF